MEIICIYASIQLFRQCCPRPRPLDITGIQMIAAMDMQTFLIISFHFSFANYLKRQNGECHPRKRKWNLFQAEYM